MQRLKIISLLLLAIGLFCGCRTEPKSMHSDSAMRFSYAMPPRQLLDAAKSAIAAPPINLSVESEENGRVTTSWESFDGARVGMAGLARQWQERTRYVVSIIPDWEDPANKSGLEVSETTQQRSHDKYDWDDNPGV